MVDWFGRWTEEKDYSRYPKENGAIMITWQHGLENRDMNLELEWKI